METKEPFSIRVVYVTPYSMNRITGIGRFVEDLARKVRGADREAAIICPDDSGGAASVYHWRVRLTWPRLRNVQLAAGTAMLLVQRRRSYDVLHVQQAHLQTLVAIVVAKVLGKPSLLTLHLRVPRPLGAMKQVAQRIVESLSIAAPVRTVAVSRAVADSFGNNLISIVENGVDTEVFKPSAPDREELRRNLLIEHEFTFLFVGRWATVKGLDILLQALRQPALENSPFRLLIVGEQSPDEPGFLTECFSRFGMDSRVLVVGPVERPEAYMNAADAFVLPSRSEGMPLVFLESLATGLPVLASDLPVHTRIAAEGECAWTFRSEDPDDLSRKMKRILESGVSNDMRKNARTVSVRAFSLDRAFSDYLRLYADIIGLPS